MVFNGAVIIALLSLWTA